MIKPITGQYECVHRSGLGLDYFTSRVDRLTIQPNGRFVLIVQDRSRVAHAVQSLANGQQVSSAAPEARREGNYTAQGNTVLFRFDDGTQQQAQIVPNNEGGNNLQLGQDVFNKISDSTLLPSADRLKKDMEDIAKGLKIAGTIGSVAIKAVKTLHDTMQTTQGTASSQGQTPTASTSAPTQNAGSPVPPAQQYTPSAASQQQTPSPYQPAVPQQPLSPPAYQQAAPEPPAVYCDQCGTRARPGKRFCNKCGASLV